MFREDMRRIRMRRRAIAIGPLTYFIEWIAAYAVTPHTGRHFFDGWEKALARDIESAFHVVANRGAFLYFGIRDAYELGNLDVIVKQLSRDGVIGIDPRPIAEHILAGGARGSGWVGPDELTVADLE